MRLILPEVMACEGRNPSYGCGDVPAAVKEPPFSSRFLVLFFKKEPLAFLQRMGFGGLG
jgi:hypothetical protein